MKIIKPLPSNIHKHNNLEKDVTSSIMNPHSTKLKLAPINNNFDFYKSYNNLTIKEKINIDKITDLNITNLHPIFDNTGVRGESLSASRNHKYLKDIKQYGINTIIDLRTADYTEKFAEKCKKIGFNFFHIPIDSQNMSDREILDTLPILFKQINKGNFYIACAQGKHRTDIALALNYLFNPKHSKTPPIMYGHAENGKLRCNDIFKRANSLYKTMTPEDKVKLDWTKQFEEEFKLRKQRLVEFNEK